MHESAFEINDNIAIYDGYTDGTHWNGWACPWFTKETALEIADAHNALMNEFNALLPNNKAYAIYNKTEDTFIFYGYDEAETEEFNCDRFASDLLYDIQSIEHHLEAQKSETLYIGFRRYGVDNNAYIATKIPQELDSTYRVIYSVKIDFEPDEYYLAKVQVTLNEVYYSTSAHEWLTLRNSKKEEN